MIGEIKGDIKNILKKETVFICYGSMNHTLDSFAPRLGTKLKEYGFEVYGTMENPINGINCIKESVRLSIKHKSKNIIAIDSCVGKKTSEIGVIKIRENKGVTPASHRFMSVEIGNHSIVGITTDNILKVVKNDDTGIEMINIMVDTALKEILKFSENL